MTRRLIVIDDETDMGNFVCEVAEQAGFSTRHFSDASQFMAQCPQDAEVIVLDLMMPGIDGIELIRFLAKMSCRARLVLMSGFDSSVLHAAEKLAREQHLDLAASLNKPFRQQELAQIFASLAQPPTKSDNAPDRHASPDQLPPVEELHRALAENELVVYYQPKLGLNGQRLPAVEALVRWQHPRHGLLGPDLFVPTAERHGLIDALTWQVLEQAADHGKAWREQGQNIQIAINMSASTLKELDLPERMGRLLREHGMSPSQIVLEITETVLVQELIRSLDILTRLRMKGFQLAIDDFGTGYSSLAQLHRAPFSEIKIDQSFIQEMEHDPEAAAIVETIIMLGHRLNMKTVAEGVDTRSCLQKLTELHCDQAQGFLLARPMPADEVVAWFQRHPAAEA